MTRSRTLSLIVMAGILIACAGAITSAWSAPFGAPHPSAVTSSSGLIGWIFTEQAAFYRSLSGFIRASKQDGVAMWELFGISLLYGVFHAVGPGHGKAVISSYLVANEETCCPSCLPASNRSLPSSLSQSQPCCLAQQPRRLD